jgi:hypothetical protein
MKDMSPRDHYPFAPDCITPSIKVGHHPGCIANSPTTTNQPSSNRGIPQLFVACKPHKRGFATFTITKRGFPGSSD